MANPVRFLAHRLRNGKNVGSGRSPDGGQATAEAEVSAGQNETVWYVGEVYQEIWDNEEDAVYDDLPAR